MSLTLGKGDLTIACIKEGKLSGNIISISQQEKGPDKKVMYIDKGYFEPFPQTKLNNSGKKEVYDPEREIIIAAGRSGSGKSTWIAMYILNFIKIFPDRNVYYFCRLDEDPVIDKIPEVKRISIADHLYQEPLDIQKDFEPGDLICFDDTDTIQDKKIRESIDALIMDILQCGRKLKLYCLIARHELTNNTSKVKLYYNELHRLVIFSKGVNRSQLVNVLDKQFGIKGKELKSILDINSRWICLSKTCPPYLLTQKEIKIL